jgi:hypothetical protein
VRERLLLHVKCSHRESSRTRLCSFVTVLFRLFATEICATAVHKERNSLFNVVVMSVASTPRCNFFRISPVLSLSVSLFGVFFLSFVCRFEKHMIREGAKTDPT